MILPPSVRSADCLFRAASARFGSWAVKRTIFARPKSATFTRPEPIQQNILRLDVAVDNPLVVGELQGVANLRHDRQRFARADTAPVQQLPQD